MTGHPPNVPRASKVARKTKETDIVVELNLDGGLASVNSGQGFFDHMLTALATYAGWGLSLTVKGDYHIDAHHSVEDAGLVLGQAVSEALGDFAGHRRFGQALIPMDDALAEAAVDLGRRPFLHFAASFPQDRCGGFELCLVEEFFRALAAKAGATMHLTGRHGDNSHHLAEAIFKSAGRALGEAARPREGGVLSTKGVLG